MSSIYIYTWWNEFSLGISGKIAFSHRKNKRYYKHRINSELNSGGKPKLADEPWKKATSQVMWLISSIRRFHVYSTDSLIFSTCAGCLYIQKLSTTACAPAESCIQLVTVFNFCILVVCTFWMCKFKNKVKLRSFVSDFLPASW